MKKLFKFLLAGCMTLSLAACGGGSEGGSDAADDAAIKVAMITDSGDITDQSFNQTTYEAGKAYCEENGIEFTYFKPESDSDDARIAMVDAAVEKGFNTLLMPGYLFASAIAYCGDTYPDVKVIALDVSQFDLDEAGATNMDNIYCATYQEEIPGYMAGYAAVKLGYTELGFLGGMAVPAVIRYGYGFVQGADKAAEELGVDINIKYVYGGQFYGDADITAVMDTWYSQGTEIVFACGGGIYTSAAEAAVKVDGKVIGVDTDQSGIIDGSYGEGVTVTSAMKDLSNTVKTLLQACVDGNFSDYAGKVDSLGMVSENADENFVGLAATTQYNDGFTEDDYKAMVAAIFNGDITISNAIEAMPSVSAHTKVDDQGTIKG